MRSSIIKTLGILLAAFVALGLVAPLASAQNYPPPPPADTTVPIGETLAVIAAQQPGNGPSITVTGDSAEVVLSSGLAAIGTNVKITACSTCTTLFDGKIPANGKVTVDLSALPAGQHSIKVTTTLPSGRTVLQTLTITKGATAAVSVPVPKLAFTGSSVNLPLALGSGLLGAGGLIVLAARKRERTA